MDEVDEVMHNATANETITFAPIVIPPVVLLIEETLLLLIGVVGIVLNVVIALCIVKFKKMRNRLNLLICSLCLVNVVVYFFNSETFRLVRTIFDVRYTRGMLCYFFHLSNAYVAASGIFMMMISLNCTFTKLSARTFKTILVVVWTLLLGHSLTNTLMCYLWQYTVEKFQLFVFLACSCVVFVSYLIYVKDVIRNNVDDQYRFRQAICGINLLMLVVSIVAVFIAVFHRGNSVAVMVAMFLYNVYFAQPVAYVIVLAKYDRNFKVCLYNLFRCKFDVIEATIRYKSGLEEEVTLPHDDILNASKA